MVDYKAKYEELSALCADFVNKFMELEVREARQIFEAKVEAAGGPVGYFNKLAKERGIDNTEDMEDINKE